MNGRNNFLNNMMPNLLASIITGFQRNRAVFVGPDGKANNFYYRNSSSNHKFKGNQHTERSLSRRRKMAISAR